MEREAELLRLLDAVIGAAAGGVPAGEAAGAAAAAAACAGRLALAETVVAAQRLEARLRGEGGTEIIAELTEALYATADRELGARLAAAAPEGPGMPWADFALETREHLAGIETDLLRLEEFPDDAEAVHAVFRGFHTIKGLAAIAGLEAAREVAHRTETLLDTVRSGTQPAHARLVDVALESADFLRTVAAAAERLSQGEPAAMPEAAPGLLSRLEEVLRNGVLAEAGGPSPAAAGRAAVPVGWPQLQAQTVKVGTTKLDQLVDLAGELVIAQSLVRQDPALTGVGDPRTARNLSRLGRISMELQKTAMSLRVVPVGQAFRRMARVFRDMVKESNKLAALETAGEDAELDRTIVERLADPLMHMIRNAVDHGLEMPSEREQAGKPAEGRVRLTAAHQAGHVVITVSDDGRGMDPEAILRKGRERGLVPEGQTPPVEEILELIFHPGLSTTEAVTAISGRGVGMDVVKREVERLRGRVEVRSEKGAGTQFLLRVPLTLAIIDGLVVRHGRSRIILPLFAVREILPGGQQVHTVEGRHEVVLVRDRVVPVARLGVLLGDPASGEEAAALVVVEGSGRRIAVAVDEVLGKQEVVIKSLGEWLGRVRGVAGGAILGDGSVGIIVDLDGLAGRDGHGGTA